MFTSVKGLVDDGKIKVVAVLSRERPAFLQQWPIMADSGLNVEAGLNLGLYVPPDTPAAIVSMPRCCAFSRTRASASASTSSAWSFPDQPGGARRTHPQRGRALHADHRSRPE
jgi:hypothetical protein